jgi:hypothetical protein
MTADQVLQNLYKKYALDTCYGLHNHHFTVRQDMHTDEQTFVLILEPPGFDSWDDDDVCTAIYETHNLSEMVSYVKSNFKLRKEDL